MDRQYWKAFTSVERIPAIARIQEDINQFGCILSFTPFSDVALALTAEVPAAVLATLHDRLHSWLNIDPEALAAKSGNGNVLVFLHITFSQGTGNIKQEQPPG